MGLHLTSEDLARYEAASRTLLSPLASASVDDWRREVNQTVRELFRGDKTVFMLPKGERLFLSEEAPDLAAGVEQYITAYHVDGIQLSDAVVDFWQHLRRSENVNVFTWSANAQMISRYGYKMEDSEMVSGVLRTHHIRDFAGCFTTTPLGEVLLWILFNKKDSTHFGEGTSLLLSALLPSLKAGLDTLIRLDAQRNALDLLTEAVIVFGPDRSELHRNTAFTTLCNTEPENERIHAEVTRMAIALSPLSFPRPGRSYDGTLTPGSRSVVTKKVRYDLKGTLLPPGIFGSDASIMITVSRQGTPELPSPETLHEQYGLTLREAEVALLLAEGHTNDAIAERLYLSPHTARRHTANIFGKLEVNTRKALALKFLQRQ